MERSIWEITTFSGGVRPYQGDKSEQELIAEIGGAFEKSDLPAVFRLIDEQFGKSVFSLRSLFRDEQRRVLDTLLKTTNVDLEELNRQAFERTAPLMRFLMDLGLALPPLFKNLADAAINNQLRHEFENKELHPEAIMNLLETAKFWHVNLDKEGLAFALGRQSKIWPGSSMRNPGTWNHSGNCRTP